ncbi:YodD family peroxide/acid resistance protein [Kosakonia cowanii]|uniref:YodD family peroxide/acid resistance protein n=1 Tax=Kosakonia cowanii TaxID=208223 RepID=UPI0023F9C47E|nr:YodD family peroxide/acid resistance protein [Kosakonia cowanii]MDF7760101.1 YodD family peroxide/acid resistance protein [Kosakonia cowanii]
MKTVREYDETAKRDVQVDIDALLSAINEISESEVQRIDDGEGQRVSVDGREYHTWRELAEAFELDVHDFSITEANR